MMFPPTLQLKTTFNDFLIRACGLILLLRILILNLFPDEYIYTKERLADLSITCLILILSLIFILHKLIKNQSFPRSVFDSSIWILLTALFFSLNHTVDFSVSINALLTWTSYILFFYILVDSLSHQKNLLSFWSYLQACLFVVIIFGVWEYFFIKSPSLVGIKRIGSIFQLPNVLAGFLMLFIPLLWANWVLTQKIWEKRMIFIFTGLCLSIFLLTFSFLCTINFIVASALVAPLIFKEWFNKSINKKFLLGLILIIIGFLILILLLRKDFSWLARWEYLKTACLLIRDNPWLGNGLDTFGITSKKYINYRLGYSGYVHNSYLQLWIETGLLGFLGALGLAWVFIKNVSKTLNREQEPNQRILYIALIWSLTAFFLDNVTNFTLLRPSIALFGWVILAGFSALMNQINQKNAPRTIKAYHKIVLGFLIVIIVGLLCVSTRLSLALFNYNQGMISFQKGNYPKAQEYFKKSSQLDPTEFRYPTALGSINIQRYFLTQKTSFLDLAEKDFLEGTRLSPSTDKNYFVLSNIKKELGDLKKSEEYLQEARQRSPLTYSH